MDSVTSLIEQYVDKFGEHPPISWLDEFETIQQAITTALATGKPWTRPDEDEGVISG